MKTIIEMAREAGWEYADDDRVFEPLWHFAELVRAEAQAEEREACAQLIERLFILDDAVSEFIAKAIRARGNT